MLNRSIAVSAENPVVYICSEFMVPRWIKDPATGIDIMQAMPIASGGLGELAGSHLKAAADRGYPLLAVGILWRKGYFKQEIDGLEQHMAPEDWDPAQYPGLQRIPELQVRIPLGGDHDDVADRIFDVWKYEVNGISGHKVPLYLLSLNPTLNGRFEGGILDNLYDSRADWWKMVQRAVLGIGAAQLMKELDLEPARWHVNDCHAAMLGAALSQQGLSIGDMRARVRYTSHTLVDAAKDEATVSLLEKLIGRDFMQRLVALDPDSNGVVSLNRVAANMAGTINVVSVDNAVAAETHPMLRGRAVFPITNGIHHSWASPRIERLLDRFVGTEWRSRPELLRNIAGLRDDEGFLGDLWQTHQDNKRDLITFIKDRTGMDFDLDAYTLGFMRRFSPYKRANLILRNPQAIVDLARRVGPLQFVFSGKAHPQDSAGKAVLREVLQNIEYVNRHGGGLVKAVFIPNYGPDVSSVCLNVDTWLNVPKRKWEASGTSGQKAALRGVPHMSTLDGWWPEGVHDGATGWSVPTHVTTHEGHWTLDEDFPLFLDVLGNGARAYYRQAPGKQRPGSEFTDKMTMAMAANGSYFRAERMFGEYGEKVYEQ